MECEGIILYTGETIYPPFPLPSSLPPFLSHLPHKHTLHSLHHVKRPGAILHPGTLIARLDLDDPSKVHQSKKFTGPLPPNSGQMTRGDKIHQVDTLLHSLHLQFLTQPTIACTLDLLSNALVAKGYPSHFLNTVGE